MDHLPVDENKPTAGVIAELLFTKFGNPKKAEVHMVNGQQGAKCIVLSLFCKETCGRDSCNQYGKWVHEKKIEFPVEILPDLIAATQAVQTSSSFEGKYRISHVFAELCFSDSRGQKRLAIRAGYGQRTINELYLELSIKKCCDEKSCDDGRWEYENEVAISSDVRHQFINALKEIDQATTHA